MLVAAWKTAPTVDQCAHTQSKSASTTGALATDDTAFLQRELFTNEARSELGKHRSPSEVNVSVVQSCDEPKPPTSTPTPNTFLSVKTRSLPVNLGFRTLVLGQTALLAAAGSAQYSKARAFPHPLTMSVGTHSHIHCSHFYHNCSTTTRVAE